LANAAKGRPSLSTSAALNWRALISRLISRAPGAVAYAPVGFLKVLLGCVLLAAAGKAFTHTAEAAAPVALLTPLRLCRRPSSPERDQEFESVFLQRRVRLPELRARAEVAYRQGLSILRGD
jgi:hypothetical protein